MSDATKKPFDAGGGQESPRPHQFDGIQEFDKPMPNWWLAILYISIAFAFLYWAVVHRYGEELDPGRALTLSMEQAAQEAARRAGVLNNDILWRMSRETAVVKAGHDVYVASCAPCHLPDLAGAIGPNLKDEIWIHGGQPMDILKVITEGVAIKGMPTWGPVLGRQKISEVTAFILSHHTPPSTPVK